MWKATHQGKPDLIRALKENKNYLYKRLREFENEEQKDTNKTDGQPI